MSHSAAAPAPDYVPDDLPPRVAALVAEYETEMDEIHPGWRTRQPFHMLDYPRLARMKWLIKRRSLLLFREAVGRAPDGSPITVPRPRDWEVLIAPDVRDPRKCYAHPVEPRVTREITRSPAKVTP